MTDLTEKSRPGWYYIEHDKFPNYTIDYLYPTGEWKFSNKESIKKIVFPVPTYDKFLDLVYDSTVKNEWGCIVDDYKQKNARLKSERDKFAYDLGVADATNWALLRLLKECVVIIGYADTISNNEENKKTIHELFTKIEEALK